MGDNPPAIRADLRYVARHLVSQHLNHVPFGFPAAQTGIETVEPVQNESFGSSSADAV